MVVLIRDYNLVTAVYCDASRTIELADLFTLFTKLVLKTSIRIEYLKRKITFR